MFIGTIQSLPFPLSRHIFLNLRCHQYLEDCSTEELLDIISELVNGKYSDIPIVLVKVSQNTIDPLLSKIYNNCMTNGEFPKIL